MSDLKRGLLGYRSTSVRAALAEERRRAELASRQARSADERAERLASELRETRQRLQETEELLGSATESGKDAGEELTAELQRCIVEREAMEIEVLELRQQLRELRATPATIEPSIGGRDDELRIATERTAALEESLRQRDELVALAREEASKARGSLLRALQESAQHQRSLRSEQERARELERLLATHRGGRQDPGGSVGATPTLAPTTETTAHSENLPPASEIFAILRVTEDAVVQIIDSTRARAAKELRSVEEDRDRILAEVETMRAWRDRAAPTISALQSTVREILGRVNEIGVQIGEAVRPLTSGVTRLGSQLASIDSLSSEPSGPATSPSGRPEGARVIELRDDRTVGRDA